MKELNFHYFDLSNNFKIDKISRILWTEG